jgi:hypothetical protein
MREDACRDAIYAAAARQHITPKLEYDAGGKLILKVPHRFNRRRFEKDLGKRLKARIEVTKTTYR